MIVSDTFIPDALKAGLLSHKTVALIHCGGLCCYCNRKLFLTHGRRGDSFTVEHIDPRSNGGSNKPDNLTGACRRCNELRGCLPVPFFRHIVETYGDNLPEYATPRYQRLQSQLSRLYSGHPTKIRLPARSYHS